MVSSPNIKPHTGDLHACLDVINRGRRLARMLLMQDTPDDLDLARPMLDAVALFESLNIDYALIGGLAAMYYGRARFTEDVDFITHDTAEQHLANNPDTMHRHHFDPTCTWKLYHESGIEIDLWRDPFVADMIARSCDAQLAGRTIRIVDPHDLIAMKLRAARPQDDYDISEILKRAEIDDHIVQARVASEEFAHFLQIKARSTR